LKASPHFLIKNQIGRKERVPHFISRRKEKKRKERKKERKKVM
jgi:hypothetical protein